MRQNGHPELYSPQGESLLNFLEENSYEICAKVQNSGNMRLFKLSGMESSLLHCALKPLGIKKRAHLERRSEEPRSAALRRVPAHHAQRHKGLSCHIRRISRASKEL